MVLHPKLLQSQHTGEAPQTRLEASCQYASSVCCMLHSDNPEARSLASNSDDFGSPAPLLGEGNGTPLQYSCLENPMDGRAWWAAFVYGVAESQTRLKRLSSNGSSSTFATQDLDDPRQAILGRGEGHGFLKIPFWF